LRHTETQEKNPLPDKDGEWKSFNFFDNFICMHFKLLHDNAQREFLCT
jgi:hypothetical protein